MSWLSKLTGKKTAPPTASVVEDARPFPPPLVKIDSHEYPAAEFVPGVFRIRPYDGDLIAKQSFDFKVSFSLNNEPIEISCRGSVARLDEKTGLIARYSAPQPYYERKLSEYLKLWGGRA